jgi:hypothetical protein
LRVSAVAGPFSQTETLPAQTIQQFLADPSALFKKYPNGGPQLLTRVREVAAYDPATLNTIVGLIQSANPNQANAIRTGGAKGGQDRSALRESDPRGDCEGGNHQRCERRQTVDPTEDRERRYDQEPS